MNRKRIREDILANLDQLPEKFVSGEYYSKAVDCYCLYGWLCVTTGGPDPKNYWMGNYAPVASYLDERYGTDLDVLCTVDRLVRTIGSRRASEIVAPAKEIVDVYLSDLEAPARG